MDIDDQDALSYKNREIEVLMEENNSVTLSLDLVKADRDLLEKENSELTEIKKDLILAIKRLQDCNDNLTLKISYLDKRYNNKECIVSDVELLLKYNQINLLQKSMENTVTF